MSWVLSYSYYLIIYIRVREAVRGVTEGYKWLGLMDFFISGVEGELYWQLPSGSLNARSVTRFGESLVVFESFASLSQNLNKWLRDLLT